MKGSMLGLESKAARYTWTAALVVLALVLVYLLRSTLFVFTLALLFAYLLSPLVNFLDRALPMKRVPSQWIFPATHTLPAKPIRTLSPSRMRFSQRARRIPLASAAATRLSPR